MLKKNKEKIERIIIKLPKSVADYFRLAFPHGKRSEFVTQSILQHKHEKLIKKMEEDLRKVGATRQK